MCHWPIWSQVDRLFNKNLSKGTTAKDKGNDVWSISYTTFSYGMLYCPY